MSARTAHGEIRRTQCRLRPVRPADAAAAHSLVCDRAGPGAVGGRVYRGLGTHCRHERRSGEEDQAAHQLPTDLSAVDRESPGDPRCCRAGAAGAPRDLSLATRMNIPQEIRNILNCGRLVAAEIATTQTNMCAYVVIIPSVPDNGIWLLGRRYLE